MTNKDVHRLSRRWTSNPGRAIPYRLGARIGDWWCAVRDARTGVSELLMQMEEDEADWSKLDETLDVKVQQALWATPHTVFLGQLGRGWAEKELIHYKAEVAGQLTLLKQARAKRQAAEDRLKVAEERLAKVTTPSEKELQARVSGEERTDKAVLAGRRMREFTERRQRAEAEIGQIRKAKAEHDIEIARLSEPIRIRFEVAQTRAAMIDAYVRRRCASYLTGLVRKHPRGKEIRPLIQSEWPERPRWAYQGASPDFIGGE